MKNSSSLLWVFAAENWTRNACTISATGTADTAELQLTFDKGDLQINVVSCRLTSKPREKTDTEFSQFAKHDLLFCCLSCSLFNVEIHAIETSVHVYVKERLG